MDNPKFRSSLIIGLNCESNGHFLKMKIIWPKNWQENWQEDRLERQDWALDKALSKEKRKTVRLKEEACRYVKAFDRQVASCTGRTWIMEERQVEETETHRWVDINGGWFCSAKIVLLFSKPFSGRSVVVH